MSDWQGLGRWNLYFLAKLALTWTGYLNFKVLPNLVFAAALLIPIRFFWLGSTPPRWLERLRQLVAVPIAIALLIHDTWYPPISRLFVHGGRGDIAGFTFDYMLELAERFINWDVLGALFVLIVVLWFLGQWLRLTTFTLLGLGWMATAAFLPVTQTPLASTRPDLAQSDSAANKSAANTQRAEGPVTTASLNAQLHDFFEQQAPLRTRFSPIPKNAKPFDVLILNICSLDWDDLSVVGMRSNALLKRMDVIFDNFNSATSYSGPASIRLLRASCGQTPNSALYRPAPRGCLLFSNLRQLGFKTDLQLNYHGAFAHYLQELRDQDMPGQSIPISSFKFPPDIQAYDGRPIFDDRRVLNSGGISAFDNPLRALRCSTTQRRCMTAIVSLCPMARQNALDTNHA
jgi:Protein of unknown function (DUF3260).